ncbi:conserved hypothetical protein [Theileria equi strain WA]|uniref:RNA-editing substrate-binding complex 6 protein domain-containing protein n=1 Tax=Theileria equi strain WA TaxID=1537102 RepID=L1LCW8_THEEQ|nr:conserved hypothetical protein [Theileria equi strain WA]EKX73129.1 conserved hypothetical protein [Theileria equi strain WA]|eukprot:XP_004832581.1 conserved hypothetical protein [Theileria equi strain WA]
MVLPFLVRSVASSHTKKDVEVVFTKLLKALPELEGSIVANSLNLLSKKEISQPTFHWRKIADILTENTSRVKHESKNKTTTLIHNYTANEICIILNAFAKINCVHHGLLNTSVKIIMDQIREVHTASICNVIHSLGKFGEISFIKDIVKKLVACSGPSARTFPGKSKKIGGYNSVNTMSWDSKTIQKLVGNFNEKDFSMILRVLLLNNDKLGTDNMVNDLLSSLATKCENLTDQTIAILVNSIAYYGQDNNGLLYVLSPIISLRLKNSGFTPQCIAQIANGYARLDVRDEVLFGALSDRVCKDNDKFSVRVIVNVLNAHAKLSIYDEKLFGLCVKKLEKRVKEMTPQCVGNTISAYSKFSGLIDRSKLQNFFNILCKYIEELDCFDNFIPQNYVNILDGLTRLEAYSQKLFLKFAASIIPLKDKLNHVDVKSLLFSIYHCKLIHSDLLLALLSRLEFVIKKMGHNFMTNSIFITSQLHFICNPDGKHFKNENFLYLPQGGNDITNSPSPDELRGIQSKLLESVGFVILCMKSFGTINYLNPAGIYTCIKSLLKANLLDFGFIDLLLQQLSNHVKHDSSSRILIILGQLPLINHKIPDHLLNSLRGMYLTPRESIDLLNILCKLGQIDFSVFNALKSLNLWKCDVIKTHLSLSLFINHMYTLQCSLETFTHATTLSRRLVNICKYNSQVGIFNPDIIASVLVLHNNRELGCMNTSMLEGLKDIKITNNTLFKSPSKNFEYELREEIESLANSLTGTVDYVENCLFSDHRSLTLLIK